MTKQPLKSLKNFFYKFVSVVESGDNPPAEVVMFKEKGGVKMKKIEEIMAELSKEDQSVIQTEFDKLPDIETANKELIKTNGELTAKVEELEKAEPVVEPVIEPVESSDEELIKSADPKIQEMLKKAKEVEVENEKLKKEKAEELVKARKGELKKEAEAYPNLGSPVEDIVEIFSSIDGDEMVTELVKGIFGAVNTALEGSELIKTIGSDKDPIEKSVEEQVDEKAEEFMKSDPTLTKEQAQLKVYKSDPDKYME